MSSYGKAAVLSVDFAPRYSAAALLDSAGALLAHTTVDVGPESEGFVSHVSVLADWVDVLAQMAGDDKPGVQVVVEDVTHVMVKPAQVLRLQGAFRLLLAQEGFSEPTMVLPGVWQKFFGWQKTPGITSKGFARFACSALGYEIKNTKGKQTTDVRDAVLIGRWFIEKSFDIV